jgi:hypothetical protein
MPPVNLFTTYGDYADNYCEDWAPVGTPALFALGGSSFAPSRLPGYPTYVMSWEQAAEQSAGADTIAYAPYVQELLIQLAWSSMSGADKAALELFYKTVAVGMSTPFVYTNLMVTGPSLPVRFADFALPSMPEVAYDRYSAALTLRVDINYPTMETSGTPAAITGNRFVLGAVAMSFPVAVRPASGYGIAKPQTLERNTAGAPVIYVKSHLTLQQHRLAMVLDYDGFIKLQSFFFTFAHGRRYKFTWYDQAETARVVRLGDSRITIKQLGYNRYAVELNLVEEI